MSATLTFANASTGVTYYTVPSDFDLHNWDDHSFSARSKVLDRFAAPGGREASDKGIKSRKVPVKGEYHAADQAALETFLRNIKGALHNNGEPFRFSWKTGEYINASHGVNFKAKRINGLWFKSAEISFDLICPDPFWYSTTDDGTDPAAVSITTDPQDISITNNGKVAAPLRIQADPTAGWPALEVIQVTDNNDLCRYTDPLLASGDTLIIDSADGTVTREGLPTKRYFSGSFLRLLPGANTIRISGVTGGTVTLSAPRRFL